MREGMYIYLWLNHVVVWQKPIQHCKAIILQLKGFPGSAVDKNSLASAGDSGSIPNLGRSHIDAEQLSPRARTTAARMLRGRTPQLLSPHAATTEIHAPRACVLQQERPLSEESEHCN